MITFQDYEKAKNKIKWIGQAVSTYMRSDEYLIALDADEYEAERNVTINNFVKKLYDITGVQTADPTASNSRISSNFFHRLNTDRCQYSLGNGVSFPDTKTKEALGDKFDTELASAAYYALIHGISYFFPNGDDYYVFPMTQFLPLWDEYTGKLRAGIRFWSLEWGKRPIQAVLYEEDGYTKYQTAEGKYGVGALVEIEKKRPYKEIVTYSPADGEEVVGGDNYGVLPIIPIYATKTKQSTLVGMRSKIDAYDIIKSGFANDLQDCAQVYWLINNAMGTNDDDIARLRDRLIYQHIAVIDSDNSSITPYAQDIPYAARKECLDTLRSSLYEDFGVLDVHTVAAGATNDHIEAGYQPMDEEADDFEYHIIQAVQQILKIKGIDPVVPQFKRNRISNQLEQTNMVMLAAQYLDERTVLSKLPFITVDEIEKIVQDNARELNDRFSGEE